MRPEVKSSLIKSAPLFGECSAAEIREITRIAEEIDVKTGATVVREGDPGDGLFVIVEGAADVRRNGRKLKSLGIGDYFGEMALLTRSPRTATVTAATPLDLLVIRRRDFGRLLDTSPTIGLKLARSLAQRVESDARVAPV